MNALAEFFVSLRIENNNNLNLETMMNMSNHKDSGRPPPEGLAERRRGSESVWACLPSFGKQETTLLQVCRMSANEK